MTITQASAAGAKVVNLGPSTFSVEYGAHLTDGRFRVDTIYSKEDAAWIATLHGAQCGEQIGVGQTQIAALMDLCSALGSVIDTYREPR